jgi:hypothetical protein
MAEPQRKTFPEDFPYQTELAQAEVDSDRNFAALMVQHPWLDTMGALGEAAVSRAVDILPSLKEGDSY